MSATNPITLLAPDQPYIVGGLDWSWAFVVYREAAGHPDYRVGSDGSAWSRRMSSSRGNKPRWKRLSPAVGIDSGHQFIGLQGYHGGQKAWRVTVHRLVLEAFIGPRPPGMYGCHNNGNPTDNRLRNLRWATPRENVADMHRHGTSRWGTIPAGRIRFRKETRAEGPLPSETFAAIAGHPGYRVSDLGRIQSCLTLGKGTRPDPGRWKAMRFGSSRGYPTVTMLHADGSRRIRHVHRVVMEAFVGPCSPGMEVRHLNDIKADCRLTNLCYGTKVENAADKRKNGRQPHGERHNFARLSDPQVVEIRRLASEGLAQAEIAARFGVTQPTVSKIALKQIWRHLGDG